MSNIALEYQYEQLLCQSALNWTLMSKGVLLQDNLQIMRDLSLLQIQMRDYDGYRVCITC